MGGIHAGSYNSLPGHSAPPRVPQVLLNKSSAPDHQTQMPPIDYRGSFREGQSKGSHSIPPHKLTYKLVKTEPPAINAPNAENYSVMHHLQGPRTSANAMLPTGGSKLSSMLTQAVQ